MQTSNFILINHDVYGKNMLSIYFTFFPPPKFICLHYWDQLHLVLSHASGQMFMLCSVRLLFIIVNESLMRHLLSDSFLEINFASLSVPARAAEKSPNDFTCFSASHACYNFPNRLVFFSTTSSALSSPLSRQCHEWKCVLCHITQYYCFQ